MTPEEAMALSRIIESMTTEAKETRIREIASLETNQRRMLVNSEYIRAVTTANGNDQLLLEAYEASCVAYEAIDAMQHEHALLLGFSPNEFWKVILMRHTKPGYQCKKIYVHPTLGQIKCLKRALAVRVHAKKRKARTTKKSSTTMKSSTTKKASSRKKASSKKATSKTVSSDDEESDTEVEKITASLPARERHSRAAAKKVAYAAVESSDDDSE
jgi:hypothetical protein